MNAPRNLSRFIFRCCHCIIILFITFPFVVFYYSLCIYSDGSYLSQFFIILLNAINVPRNLSRFIFRCCHCIIILFITFPFVVFYYSLCIYSDCSYLSQFSIILSNTINGPRNLNRFVFRCCHCIIILFITFPFVVFYYSLCIYSDWSYLSQFFIILSNAMNAPRNLNRFIFRCCHCIIILLICQPLKDFCTAIIYRYLLFKLQGAVFFCNPKYSHLSSQEVT